MLSPYNGCSLRKFLIDHSELEALTDYLLCYTVQLTKPESGEQALFSKAGGEWVALTPRATSKPSRHIRPWLGLAGARGESSRERVSFVYTFLAPPVKRGWPTRFPVLHP